MTGKSKQSWVPLVAALLILAAGVFLYRTVFLSEGPDEGALVKGLGGVVGEQVVKALGPGSEVVVLNFSEEPDAEVARQKKELLHTLRRGQVTVSRVKTIDRARDPAGLDQDSFALGAYLQTAEESPEVDAIVTLTGAMQLQPGDVEEIPASAPPLVLLYVDGHQPELDALLRRGLVKLAIVPRPPERVTSSGPPATPQEWLTDHFDLVTPE